MIDELVLRPTFLVSLDKIRLKEKQRSFLGISKRKL